MVKVLYRRMKMHKEINFILNGEKVNLDVTPGEILLEVLRDRLGIKSPKCGCNKGDCGTCTVILNGKTVRSCLVLAIEVDNQEVVTIEGLMHSGLTELQESFLKHNSFQCGFCAPGIILSATELLGKNSRPEKREIQEAIAGNLCRCSGYSPIIDAIIDITN
jgi:aerobic carbon-monoxide dehydrogenase small subunit